MHITNCIRYVAFRNGFYTVLAPVFINKYVYLLNNYTFSLFYSWWYIYLLYIYTVVRN